MQITPQLKREIEKVIKAEDARTQNGLVISDITTIVYNNMQRKGGPTKFGIGTADQIMMFRNYISQGVRQQFQSKMPDSFHRAAMATCPPALVQTMTYLPQKIAIEQGPKAHWVSSIRASANDWQAHGRMKYKIAEMTRQRARVAEDIMRYLQSNGFTSLGNALGII
jgi:hypothetical protein